MTRTRMIETLASAPALRATLVEATSWHNDKTTRYISASFAADGIYKSLVCRLAEECGCRYASHRSGYRFSLRAWAKFKIALAEKAAAYPGNLNYRQALAALGDAPELALAMGRAA